MIRSCSPWCSSRSDVNKPKHCHSIATCGIATYSVSSIIPPTQADAVKTRFRVFGSAERRAGTPPSQEPAILLQPPDPVISPIDATGTFPRTNPACGKIELQDLKTKNPVELLAFAEEQAIAECQRHAQAGADVRHPQAARRREIDIIGEGVVEVLSDGFGFLRSPKPITCPRPDPTLSSRPRRSARFGLRTGDTIDGHIRSPKEGGAISRCSRSTPSISRTRKKPGARINFDNLTPLHPEERLKTGARGSDQEGSLAARHRYRCADRQGSARADRFAAAHRQDGAVAEHRACRHRQSPGMLSDRALDRRAAGRSHRHAALGTGRRSCPRLSTSRPRATSPSPRW